MLVAVEGRRKAIVKQSLDFFNVSRLTVVDDCRVVRYDVVRPNAEIPA